MDVLISETLVLQRGESWDCYHVSSFLRTFLSNVNLICHANSTKANGKCAHCRMLMLKLSKFDIQSHRYRGLGIICSWGFDQGITKRRLCSLLLPQPGAFPKACIATLYLWSILPNCCWKASSRIFLLKILLQIMLLHISRSAYTGIVSQTHQTCHFSDEQPRNINSSIFFF